MTDLGLDLATTPPSVPPGRLARALSALAAIWVGVGLSAWIAALLGAPLMVTLGDHVAGMLFGAFGSAVLALLHTSRASIDPPRWEAPVALSTQLLLLLGGAAATFTAEARAPGLLVAAVGWAAVTVAVLGRGALAASTAAAAGGLVALALGHLDLGVGLGVHAFLVPAAVLLAERVDRGPTDPPVAGERVVATLGLLRALLRADVHPAVTGVLDVLLVLAFAMALADRGPWWPGPRSGALRVGLVWLIVAYAGDALALALGELVGSLPIHAALVGGVGSLLVAAVAVIGEGRWPVRSAAALVLVQLAALARVLPLAVGRPSPAAMVAATVAGAVGLGLGFWLRRADPV